MPLISTGIAAKILGINPNTLRKNYQKYGFTKYMVGNLARWDEGEIEQYLNSNGVRDD